MNSEEQTFLEMTGIWTALRHNQVEQKILRAELALKLEDFEAAVMSGNAPCPIEEARLIMKDMKELIRGGN